MCSAKGVWQRSATLIFLDADDFADWDAGFTVGGA
jgi:hypothetical protein